jgi:hypothetical protein
VQLISQRTSLYQREIGLVIADASTSDGSAIFMGHFAPHVGIYGKNKMILTITMVGVMCTRIYKKILKCSTSGSEIQFNSEEVGDALHWGLVAASATLTHSGPTLGSKKEIKKYYPRIELTMVSE